MYIYVVTYIDYYVTCMYVASKRDLEGDKKKSRQAQNLANSKKSTILLQSLWNLVKMIISRVDLVARISAWSD